MTANNGNRFENIAEAELSVQGCRHCETALGFQPRPVVRLSDRAEILIIGQAPGTRVHETGIPWNDRSGDRLRSWLNVTREQFYDRHCFAIMPLGFCFPGRDAKGGDLPPRPECAPLWHDRLLAIMPRIALTLLIGAYAQRYYLNMPRGRGLGETIQATMRENGRYLALPHPSWRNTGWLKKNRWFEESVLPYLRKRLRIHGIERI